MRQNSLQGISGVEDEFDLKFFVARSKKNFDSVGLRQGAEKPIKYVIFGGARFPHSLKAASED